MQQETVSEIPAAQSPDLTWSPGAKVGSEGITAGSEKTGFSSIVLRNQGCKINTSADCWGTYEDFFTDASGNFTANFSVPLDAATVSAGVSTLTVNTVLRGSRGVLWTFSLLNNATQHYDVVGNTNALLNWVWTSQKFAALVPVSNYINAQGIVMVRLSVVNSPGEDAAVDTLTVMTTTRGTSTGAGTTGGSTSTGTGIAAGGTSTGGSTTTGGGTTVGGSTGGVGTATGSGTTTGITTGGTATGGTSSGTTTGGNATSWWKPTPSDTFLWDLDLSNVPSPAVSRAPSVTNYDADVYDIDPTNLGASGIATLHNNGKKVVCYVDVGSWEPYRADAANFNPACICGAGATLEANGNCSSRAHEMQGWTEWWFDLHDASCVANVEAAMAKRLQAAAALGCDAIEPDNLDSFENQDQTGAAAAGWGNTMADENNYITHIAQEAHALGMGIMLKNAGDLLVDGNGNPTTYSTSIVEAFDGSLNEQCHQYSECADYQAFGNAGKAMWNAEYLNSNSTSSCGNVSYKTSYCGTPGMKTLQYSCLAVEYDHLAYVCP